MKKKLQNRNIKIWLTGSFVGHNYSNFETILVDCKIKQTNIYIEVLGARLLTVGEDRYKLKWEEAKMSTEVFVALELE